MFWFFVPYSCGPTMMYLQDTVEVSQVTQYSLLIFGPSKGASPKKIGFVLDLFIRGWGSEAIHMFWGTFFTSTSLEF